MLALGIGANTAVFTLINSMLLKPRPGVPDAELAGVFSRDRTQADAYRAFSYPNYADLRARKDLFVSLTAHNFSLLGLTEGDQTRRIFVDVITAELLRHVRRACHAWPRVHGRGGTAGRRPARDDSQLRHVAAPRRPGLHHRLDREDQRPSVQRRRRRGARVLADPW